MILLSGLRGLAAALALSMLADSALAADVAPAPPGLVQPPPDVQISFAYFEQRLSAFGHWISHPVWGEVWQPDAGRNFRPYFYGYWQNTSDYGWLWVSNEPYGDIVYHYGRWVYDPNFGWLWVPGYIWAPSWVAWREADGYIGWLPLPPGYQDFALSEAAPAYGPSDLYGYQYFYGSNFAPDAFAGLWLFVPLQEFGHSDRRPYVVDKDRLGELYRRSRDRTHYEHDRDHDRIVDRSVDADELERAGNRNFAPQPGRRFLRQGTPVVSVTEGQDIARHDHERDRSRPIASGVISPNYAAPAGAGSNLAQPDPVRAPLPPPFLGRRDARQGQGENGPLPYGGDALPGSGPGVIFPPRNARPRSPEPYRSASGPAQPVAPNTPSTEGLRGREIAPGLGPQAVPQMGTARDLSRGQMRGLGQPIAPALSAPGMAVSVPPNAMPGAVLRPVPPIAPVAPPSAQPAVPAAAVPAPRSGPVSPQKSPFPSDRGTLR